MEANLTDTTNEVGQIIVELPCANFSKSNFVLAQDEGKGWQIISPKSSRVTFRNHTPVSLICDTRAKYTVRGSLLLNGKKVTLQQYLKKWRTTQVISVEKLSQQFGLCILVHARIHLQREREALWSYNTKANAIKKFEDFERKYPKYFNQPVIDGEYIETVFCLDNSEIASDFEHVFSNSNYNYDAKNFASTISFSLGSSNLSGEVKHHAMNNSIPEQSELFSF